jgi:cation diffusion facilitator family transporter
LSSNDLKKGAKIARVAFLTVLAVGTVEVVAASFATSVALFADGIQSIATSLIFLIIWIGIRLSGRSADGTFHFGYYRIEALGSLVAAFILSVFGGIVLLQAFDSWLAKREVANAEIAILLAGISALIILLVSVWINQASKKVGSSALKVGGLGAVLDAFASVAVLIGVVLSRYGGILHADSIAGIFIAGAIFVGAYSIFKESSLVLVDACSCGDLVGAIGEISRSIKGVKEVHSIRLRKLGPFITGDMHVVVSSDMMVREADQIATEVEEKIKNMFDKVMDFKIRIESDEAHDRHSQEVTIKNNEIISEHE